VTLIPLRNAKYAPKKKAEKGGVVCKYEYEKHENITNVLEYIFKYKFDDRTISIRLSPSFFINS